MASLSYHKGIFTLLDAFALVSASIPSCKLTIAGTGKDLDLIKQKIQQMSCNSQITLLGNVPKEQVFQVMNQCTVYCLPSYGEPFGISVLEAMSCGKPVVVTNAGGLAYLVDKQGGIKVPLKDEQALAEALVTILKSPQLQRNMGEHNLRLVENVYDWDIVIHKLENIYYSLLPSEQESERLSDLELANY